MATLGLIVNFEYDDNLMHGDDKAAKDWFLYLLENQKHIVRNQDIGDDIGVIEIVEVLSGDE